MELQDFFSQNRKLIDDRIYQKLAPDFERVEAKEVIKYMFRIGGKRLRPLLLLISHTASGGREEVALDGAAAVELIHAASLIFDDILDKDKTRRRFLATHLMFSDEQAVSSGLFLASKGVQILSEYREESVMRIISDALVDISKGEVLDVLLRDNLDVKQYLAIANMKTASLFSASAGIGGVLARGTGSEVNSLLNFGRFVGIAYQIIDDVMDLRGPSENSPLLKLKLDSEVSTNSIDTYEKYALQLSGDYIERAKKELSKLNSSASDGIKALKNFADDVVRRQE